MKTVMFQCPSDTDATSLYRGWGPLARLKRSLAGRVEFTTTTRINWASLGMADVLFLQRPYTKDHLVMAEMAKDNGLRIWVDYDDDIFRVPTSNPTHRLIYGKDDVKKQAATIIAMADAVTVTTEHLKGKLEPLNKNITVIPNALDTDRFRTPSVGARNPLFLWRGSETHDQDIAEYSEAIIRAALELKEFTFTFIGAPFWGLIEQMPTKQTVVAEPIDPISYMSLIARAAPAAMFVPLNDCEFNRSKSNIAWIEGCYAGAPTIAPNWQAWDVPGVVRYTDKAGFFNAMIAVAADPGRAQDLAREGMAYIRDCLTLEKANELRARVIFDLV